MTKLPPNNHASVSVVIPVYNAIEFIDNAIDSVLSQAGVDVELILVDDASTDGTTEYLRKLAYNDETITLIELAENRGPSVARNAGIAIARGEWVAILDADDKYADNRLSNLVTVGTQNSADLVADNISFYDLPADRFYKPALATAPCVDVIDIYAFTAGAIPDAAEADYGLLKPIFRRDGMAKFGITYRSDIRHAEDFDLIFSALSRGARYVIARSAVTYVQTLRSSGHSRTRIDYGEVVARTKRLRVQSLMTRDLRLAALLQNRVDKLVAYMLSQNIRSGGASGLAIFGFGYKALASSSGRKWLRQKLSKRFGV